MKKTTLWLAMLGALGLAGCGGGGGDSGGGTTPPEPQPRVLPDAGAYLPVLMDAQGQLINRPVNDSYRAVGFVYPAGVVAQISQQIMISPAPSDRYTRGFLTGRPRVFSLFIALTYAITSPT